MKKKVLSLFLALGLCLGLLPTAAMAAEEDFVLVRGSECEEWEQQQNGYTPDDLILKKYKGPGGEVTVPDGVTVIGQNAFSSCAGLTGVTIPAGVKAIEDFAFVGCPALTRVTLPEGVTKLGYDLFEDSQALTEFNVPNSVKSIDFYCFEYTPWFQNLKDEFVVVGDQILIKYNGPGGDVKIPEGIKTVNDTAFCGNDSITSLTFAESVTRIQSRCSVGYGPQSCVDGCGSLEKIVYPSTLTTIPYGFGCSLGSTEMTVPGSIKKLAGYNFAFCDSLQTVIIQEGVTSIGAGSFSSCPNLTKVVIPASVTEIKKGSQELLESDPFYESPHVAIYGVAGSYAETYARENKLSFVPITASTTPTTPAIVSTGVNPAESGQSYANPQTVNIDGKAVSFQMYALKNEEGGLTNYIKLRDLAAALDGTKAQFNVGWNGAVNIETGKTYTTRNGQEGKTPYSGDRAYQRNSAATNVNGAAVDLQAFVLTDDNGGGYTYYKLRDLGQALGFNVGWSGDRGVFIETDKPYDPNN